MNALHFSHGSSVVQLPKQDASSQCDLDLEHGAAVQGSDAGVKRSGNSSPQQVVSGQAKETTRLAICEKVLLDTLGVDVGRHDAWETDGAE